MRTVFLCWRKSAAWIQRVIREIAFIDYYSEQRLQQAFASDLFPATGTLKKGDIDAVYERRRALIKLWHQNIPLLFCFVPLWFFLAYPILQGQLSALQSVAIIITIIITGICYLQTFYRDGLNYHIRLVQVKERLLLGSLNHALPTIATPKGSIPLLLLDQLVRKEAGQLNLFDADLDETLPFYKALIGFNEKNFKKILPQYRRRQDICFDKENARTTHIGYLDILIRHYAAINDNTLKEGATALQAFLNRKPLN